MKTLRTDVLYDIYYGGELTTEKPERMDIKQKCVLSEKQRTFLYKLIRDQPVTDSDKDKIEDILHQHYYYSDQREWLNDLKHYV